MVRAGSLMRQQSLLGQNGIKDRILDVISKNPGAPIYKIAKDANVSVATASKYCYILHAENKIKITSFGNMKLVSKK